ncbi:hypothetical protein JKF63_00684 [Porcisia hertigi]|uniref:Abnormal spindle-like microcephaly-associated protein n=1 Tax=Porcisia hertigi TaxID=2761500 RepID=A0A836KXE2_9TRYP|nr:hypothetical protein JKF63_00684 [Porcisia hertigi]
MMEGDTNYIYQYANREGRTGLELDVFYRHYSRITPAYGCRLMNAVLSALEDAKTHAPMELSAALKIQSTFRMFRQRKAFLAVRQNACLIQRVFRGYATRTHLDVERTTVRQVAYLQTVFDMFATRIQACYRGYQSRKMKANYYAQKAYLQVVTARSSQVLAQAHSTQVEQDTLRNAEAQRVHELSYARRTARMHYMVSTSSVASVYQRFGAPSWAIQPSQDTLPTDSDVHNYNEVRSLASPVPPTVNSTGGTVDGELLVSEVGNCTSGQKLEKDIRHNARAARREPTIVKTKTDRSHIASTVPQTASPESHDNAMAGQKAAERLTASTTNPAQGTRLPPLKSSRLAQRDLQPSASVSATVPWELSTTHPPKRPLTTQAPPSAGPSFSETAPPAVLPHTLRASRKTHCAQHNTENECPYPTGVAGGAAAGSAPSADTVNSSMPSAAVSSFHRRFDVKRHDCLEHHLSIVNGVTSNGADAHTFSGPISSSEEYSAGKRRVDQKVIQALHGDAIFKVPAGRGRR